MFDTSRALRAAFSPPWGAGMLRIMGLRKKMWSLRPIGRMDHKMDFSRENRVRRSEEEVRAGISNRLDKIVVFHPLRREQLEQILEIELASVTALGLKRFRFHLAPAARDFLLSEGTDLKYGARNVKRAIERYVVNPLARLVATDQVNMGDVLLADRHPGDKGLAFWRDTQQSPSLSEVRVAASHSRSR